MARPVVGIIGNSHLINDEYPTHAGGTMNSRAVAAGVGLSAADRCPADPGLVTGRGNCWRPATAFC